MKEDKARFSLIHGLDEHGKRKLQLKITLSGDILERFLVVKDSFDVQSNNNVVILLITKEYSRLQKDHKVFIAKDVYRQLEARAKELGLSVDEYAGKITEQHLKTRTEEVLKTPA